MFLGVGVKREVAYTKAAFDKMSAAIFVEPLKLEVAHVLLCPENVLVSFKVTRQYPREDDCDCLEPTKKPRRNRRAS
jgi:hypothetical protein